MNRGWEAPCTYSQDPLSGVKVQLGLLGLQVLPEGLLQCRTQQRNRSERERKRRERGREGRGEKEKKGRRMGGWGGWGGSTNHVTSLLLTSPRAATKGGMLSCVLYSVGLSCFLSPLRRESERERRREQRVQSLHCTSPQTQRERGEKNKNRLCCRK